MVGGADSDAEVRRGNRLGEGRVPSLVNYLLTECVSIAQLLAGEVKKSYDDGF
jgi:hypothetical protein